MATRNAIDIVARIRGNIAESLNRAAKASRALSAALRDADKSARRTSTGLSKIGSSLEKIGTSLPALVGSGGLAIALKRTADTAFQAHAQMMVFRRTLGAFNQDVEDGVRQLELIAEKLQVAPEQIAASASLMLRAGYNMKEVVQAFEAGAASALAAGKTVMSGVENVALALSTGLSIYLNYIGIAENIGPVIRRVIAAHKNASAEVVKAAQNQAALNVVLKATAQEVKALPILLGGYQGAMNRMNVALFEFSKTLGQEVLPGFTTLIANATAALKAFNELPQYVKAFTVGISATAIAVTTLAAALAGLEKVLGVLGGPAGLIMLVVTAFGGLANVLYNKSIPAIGEGKKALEKLAEAAASARKEVNALNLAQLNSAKDSALNAWMRGIRTLRKELGDADPAVQKFLDDLTKAGIEGKPLEGLDKVVHRIELYTEYLRNSGRDAAAAPVLNLARQLIDLRDLAETLETATKELKAYKKAAKDLLKQPLAPAAPNTGKSKTAKDDIKELGDLAILTGSYFRKLNHELGRTPDLIDKIGQHARRAAMSALRASTQDRAIESTIRHMVTKAYQELRDQINRMDFPKLIADSILAGTDQGAELLGRHYASKIAHGFDVGIKAAAAQMAADLEEGLLNRLSAGVMDRNIEIAIREAAAAADEGLRTYQKWLQTLNELDDAVRGYAAELDEATYAAARAREEAERLLAPGSAMSPDTWDRLQKHLEGANKELVRYVHTLYSAGTIKTALSPDAMERNTRHAALIRKLLQQIADALKEDQKRTEQFNESMASVLDTASLVNGAVNQIFDAMEAGRKGDSKSLFAGITNAISSLAKLIPSIGDAISMAISTISSLMQRFWDALADPRGIGRAAKRLDEIAEKFTFIKRSAFDAAKEIKKVWRRTWLFGGETFDITTINEAMLKRITSIAQAFESGVSSALRSGIMAFLHGDANWREKLRNGIRDAIYNAIIEAVIQAGIIQGLLADQLSGLTEELAKKNWEAAKSIIGKIDAQIDGISDKVANLFEGFKFAAGGGGGGSIGNNNADYGIYYNLPAAPIIATPPWVDQMGRAIDKFDEAVDRMLTREERHDTWLGWFTRGALL